MIFSILTKFYELIKKNNIVSGLIIFEVISTILLFIFPYYLFFYYGEIGVIIGIIFGMYFAFHNRKKSQRSLKINLYFIIFGTLIISFSFSLIEWSITIPVYGFDPIVFLSLFISNLIMVFFYTLLIGLFMAYFYSRKEEY